jgi:hypothetical protein
MGRADGERRENRPIEPIDRAEPIEPIDKKDPRDPISVCSCLVWLVIAA